MTFKNITMHFKDSLWIKGTPKLRNTTKIMPEEFVAIRILNLGLLLRWNLSSCKVVSLAGAKK
jgi:hypothetical protein